MKLNVHELQAAGLMQRFTVGSNPLDVYAIRPHLYKHLSPAGSLYMEIRSDGGSLLSTSETLTISSIHSNGFASANYGHGDIRFYTSARLAANTTYQLWLKSTGYTYANSAFIGWCNDFDLRKIDKDFTGPASALLFDLFTYQYLTKGL